MEFQKPKEKMLLREVLGEKQGAKISYSKLQKAMLHCELSNRDNECKRMMKELGVVIIED